MILYKYLPSERFSFFQDYLLRFTQPSEFNDIFDTMTAHSFLDLPPADGNKNHENFRSELLADLDKITQTFNDHLGILCLCEIWNNMLMWSHYAGNHTGFVVGFDVSQPFFDLYKTLGLNPVRYVQDRPTFSAKNILTDELYTKSLVWSSELEWRLCKEISHCDVVIGENGGIFLFEIPKESVRELYFGVRMDNQVKRDILGQIFYEKMDIHIYQMEKDYQTYDLNRTPVQINMGEIMMPSSKKMQRIYQAKWQRKEKVVPKDRGVVNKRMKACLLENIRVLNLLSTMILPGDRGCQYKDGKQIKTWYKELNRQVGWNHKDINTIPRQYKECRKQMTLDQYETYICPVLWSIDTVVHRVNRFIGYLKMIGDGDFGWSYEEICDIWQDCLNGAKEAFSNAIAWSCMSLKEEEIQQIKSVITFSDKFEGLTCGKAGFRVGQKCEIYFHEKKVEVLREKQRIREMEMKGSGGVTDEN